MADSYWIIYSHLILLTIDVIDSQSIKEYAFYLVYFLNCESVCLSVLYRLQSGGKDS